MPHGFSQKPEDKLLRVAVRAIPCRKCGADRFEKCQGATRKDGIKRKRSSSHQERWDDYRKSLGMED